MAPGRQYPASVASVGSEAQWQMLLAWEVDGSRQDTIRSDQLAQGSRRAADRAAPPGVLRADGRPRAATGTGPVRLARGRRAHRRANFPRHRRLSRRQIAGA